MIKLPNEGRTVHARRPMPACIRPYWSHRWEQNCCVVCGLRRKTWHPRTFFFQWGPIRIGTWKPGKYTGDLK